MPPPSSSDHPAFRLRLLDNPFQVVQLRVDKEIPEHYIRLLTESSSAASCFISVTRTCEEVSIVLESPDGSEEATWRCIKIAGPMDFGITGVMCNCTLPLRTADIPVFAVSTWNTDYILVPKESTTRATEVLKQDGWQFDDAGKS